MPIWQSLCPIGPKQSRPNLASTQSGSRLGNPLGRPIWQCHPIYQPGQSGSLAVTAAVRNQLKSLSLINESGWIGVYARCPID